MRVSTQDRYEVIASSAVAPGAALHHLMSFFALHTDP